MCLAVPSLVLGIEGAVALVEAFGIRRSVDLSLLDEPVAPGDYLLVRNGRIAIERLEAGAAREALAWIEAALALDQAVSGNEEARGASPAPAHPSFGRGPGEMNAS